ncbi:MAG: tetratricopeptide repeat protein, partial [Planctomycetes bacterium]|nr:tetratricopeptide repeat protein [Planctomycetota bacterium]
PYMRARLGLANSLWTAGRREEAVRHLEDMLRLNPGDNQGLRYTLAGYLVALDRDEDLARLLDQYPEEDSATWAYTRLLLAFRREGDTPATRKLFKEARKTNKHIPTYLQGREPLQPPLPYSPGDENEANNFAVEFIGGWKSTPGALAWLREQNRGKKKRKADRPPPKGPLALTKNWLKKRLEPEDEVWQADFRQLPQWVESDGQRTRLWLVLVVNRDADLVLAHDLGEEEPAPARLWDTLVQAMQHPLAGTAHRPTELQVLGREAWTSLWPHFEEVGIQLETVAELGPWEEVYQSLSEHLGGRPQPGLLDVPGVTPEQVAGFYEAAAYFYTQAPWRKVGYEAAIKVACTKFESSPWYAVLMGQGGMTLGLALYDDPTTLRRLWTRDASDEENARETVGTSVTFGEETEIPVADLDAARQYGWKVARPEAYPCVFHKERGMSLRPPLAWELELMEGCLRAIPEFVNRHPDPESRAKETTTVPAAKGELTLELTWVGDLEE